MECPVCKNNVTNSIKGWKYRNFDVKLFKCEHCGKSFNVYYLNGNVSHTIANFGSRAYHGNLSGKIIMYLRTHSYASEEDIARDLNVKVNDLVPSLDKLWKKGILSKYRLDS